MNDRAVSLLEQYEIEVAGTRKGRGAILCDTDRGTLILKEYQGNPRHLKVQDRLLRTISERGFCEGEMLLPTKEGELYVKDHDGVAYLLKTYREGRECNVREMEECLAAVRLMAKLHLYTQEGLLLEKQPEPTGEQPEAISTQEEPTQEWKELTSGEKDTDREADFRNADAPVSREPRLEIPVFSMAREYEKRNRELKKIRKFLLGRSQKTWFEISLLGCFDAFYEQAKEAREGWEQYRGAAEREAVSSFCHGDYQYHNVLCDQKSWYLINFERCVADDPVRDLHLLLRKLLEKSNWSISLGERLLREYEKTRPLSAVSKIDLYYRLSYPEKFWKIANFYYNSGKAWIPGKNLEKLEKVNAQEKEKRAFLEAVFRI